jgi:predicted nucleic acid-binding protein
VGVLLLAKQRGLIPGVRQILDDLIAQGTYISQKLYQYVLTQAQE